MDCWCRLSVVVVVVVVVVLCTLPPVYTRHRSRSSDNLIEDRDPVWEIRHILPNIDLENNTVRDVRVNTGEMAYLPCRFPQLSTLHQVSWMRRQDWHILTTGLYPYTSDLRFNVLHKQNSDDWTLQIKRVDKRDNGTYECQMYTGTGVLSQFVNLHVSTPRAAILGPRELHVQEGDTVTLACIIQQSKPPFVFWYHGELMVNYDDRLTVMTRVEGSRTHSKLTIHDAMRPDSGNYSCIPPNVTPAHVVVFVSETGGDTVAAVQRRGHTTSASSSSSSFLSSSSSSSSSFVFYLRFAVLSLSSLVITQYLPPR